MIAAPAREFIREQPHWPFAPLTPMQQRWAQEQREAMQQRTPRQWPLGVPLQRGGAA